MIQLYSTIQYEGEQWIALSYSSSTNQYRITREGAGDIWISKDDTCNVDKIERDNSPDTLVAQNERFRQLKYVKEYGEYFSARNVYKFDIILENVLYYFYTSRTDEKINFINSLCPYDVCRRLEHISKKKIIDAEVVKRESLVFGSLFKNQMIEIPTLIRFKMNDGKTWIVKVEREIKKIDLARMRWV